jgi:hypothetical protein
MRDRSVGREIAHTSTKPDYAEWLKRYKVDDMDKSDRAKLLQLMEERPAVEELRMTLADYERRMLNNPVIVWRKWTAATRVKKPTPRSAGVSASEHGRAQATVAQLQARVEELEEELAAVREEIERLQARIVEQLEGEEPGATDEAEEPARPAAPNQLPWTVHRGNAARILCRDVIQNERRSGAVLGARRQGAQHRHRPAPGSNWPTNAAKAWMFRDSLWSRPPTRPRRRPKPITREPMPTTPPDCPRRTMARWCG